MTNDKTNKPKPSYFSVVPAEVRYCKGLGNASPRDLYGEISALCNEKGFCWANNRYFADLYEVDTRTIQRWIFKLEKFGFIYIDLTGKRKIFLKKDLLENSPKEEVEEAPAEEEKPKKKKKKKKNSGKKVKSVVKQKFEKEDLELAELLHSKIIFNFPIFENKVVNIETWADDIRKLRKIDKATYTQIEFMIYWIHGGEMKRDGRLIRSFKQNDFWSQNIMSASKLRKQWFDNLIPKLQESMKKQVKKETVGKF